MVPKLNSAVVGLGMFGSLQAQFYAESPLSELRAVADPTPERAQEIGEKHGVHWYTDYNEMLARETLDVVSVANRDAEHPDAAIAVARAGVHLFLEKPMAPTLEQAENIIREVEKAGVKMMVNFTLRFEPTYLTAYERIRAGEIGEVVTMFGRRNGTILGANYYGTWTDMLISTGIHELDAMVWYAGSQVKRVYGESARGVTQGLMGDDAYMALLRFQNGAIGSLESSWILPGTNPAKLDSRFDIVGSQGGIFIENVNKTIAISNAEGALHPDVTYWPTLRGQVSGALHNAMTHFMTCLLEDNSPIVGAEEGWQSLRLVLAIQESCRSGQVVYLAEGV